MIPQHPIFDPALVKRFEYDVNVIKYIDGQPNEILDKLVIHPIEVGNRFEFKSKVDSNVSFYIAIEDITELNTPEQTKEIPEKKDLLLEIEFKDSHGNKQSIAFNVQDKHIEEILVKTLKPMEQNYWDTVDLEYNLAGIPKTTQLYYKTPFLSDDEELLWINTKTEGIIGKHLKWLEALTNFRAIYYDFDKHDSGRIPLIFVDDVIVKNQGRTSESNRFGTFIGDGNRTFAGTDMSMSHETSGTIGDVLFIREGKPIIIFYQISNPHAVARLAKAVIGQLFTSLKAGKKIRLPMIDAKISEPKDPLCSYCGNVNPSGLELCNKCGFPLQSKRNEG